MRILFLVCGIGFGHASRTYKVIQRLLSEGIEVFVATSSDALQYFWSHDLKNVIAIPGMRIKWSAIGLSPLYSSLHYVRRLGYYKTLIHIERRVIERLEPDVIVMDSRPISQLSTRIYKNIPRLVLTNQLSISSNLDFINNYVLYRWFPKVWYTCDKVAVLDLPPPYTITYKNNVLVLARHPKHLTPKIVFTGPIIDFPRISIDVRKRIWDVGFYISAPYYDKKIFTRDVLRISRLLEGYRVRVSLGDPDMSRFRIRTSYIDIVGWVSDKYDFLSSVRIVVLRGGQTSIFESIYSMTPMLIIPAVNQTEQMENAKRVSELGIGEYIDHISIKRDNNIFVETINRMLENYDYYISNLVNIRRHLIRYNGLDKVFSLILNMVN